MASDIKVVAAIDFGTSHSGYAFSFKSGTDGPPTEIFDNRCAVPRGNNISAKEPTIALFDSSRVFHSFGYEAEMKYNDLIDLKEHKTWFCFKNFKMKLHEKMKLRQDLQLEDEQGHLMDAHIVFAESIRYMKRQCESKLQTRHPLEDYSIIHWVITVPAIWTQAAKQFMREAAREAGIPDEHLQLALEPEAAALYCKSVMEGNDNVVAENFRPSGRYMILDLGGGTVDIAVHEVAQDGSLMELTKASGGGWGGGCVDKTFYEYISNKYGKDFIDQFRKNRTGDWTTFMYDFENQKRKLKNNSQTNVRVEIPQRLIVESNIQVDVISFNKMIIEHENFVEFFTPATEHIVQHVRKVLQRVENVSLILMVGGFSQSEYVLGVMKKSFPNYRIIVPLQAEVAVLHGAVLYGFEPWKISARVCQFTYGVSCRIHFQEGIHAEEYRVMVDGKAKCRHIFKSIATEGEKVKTSEIRTYELYSSHMDPQKKFQKQKLEIFASTDMNPTYTTDKSCSCMGKIVIDPPADGWPDKVNHTVEIFFGRTEFQVKIRNDASQGEYTSHFEFLDFTRSI